MVVWVCVKHMQNDSVKKKLGKMMMVKRKRALKWRNVFILRMHLDMHIKAKDNIVSLWIGKKKLSLKMWEQEVRCIYVDNEIITQLQHYYIHRSEINLKKKKTLVSLICPSGFLFLVSHTCRMMVSEMLFWWALFSFIYTPCHRDSLQRNMQQSSSSGWFIVYVWMFRVLSSYIFNTHTTDGCCSDIYLHLCEEHTCFFW